MVAFLGAVVLLWLGCGLVGLVFKDNRNDKEYVANVKSAGWNAFQFFILYPLLAVVILIVAVAVAFK